MKRGIVVSVAVTLAFAAMVLAAFGVLMESAIRSHGGLDRYTSATAVVSGKQSVTVTKSNNQKQNQPLVERNRVPLAAADPLRTIPGVRAVIADLSVPVQTASGSTLAGHGWDSAQLVNTPLVAGRAPAGSHDVVLDARTAAALGAGPGSAVTLQTTAAPERYYVAGLTTSTSPGTTGIAYFTQQQAQTLTGHPDRADALVVLARPGSQVSTTRLRHAAPGLAVVTGTARGDVENPAMQAGRTAAIAMPGAIGGIGLLVVLLVVTGLLELSVRDRARSLAVMRAVGATPRQVRRIIVRETLRISVPAGVLGGAGGLGLGAVLKALMTSQDALPDGFRLFLSPLPAAAAALLTVLSSVGCAWLAARRVSRIRPVQALGESAVEPTRLPRWRVITGLVFLLLGAALLVLTLAVGGQSAAQAVGALVISLMWAVALLGPWIARAGIAVLGAPLRLLAPITGRLASTSARAAAVRMAAVITPIALALSFAATQLFAQDTGTHATAQQAIDGLRAKQILVSSGPGIPHAAYDAVRSMPAAEGVTAVKRTTVVMPVRSTLESLQAQGLEGALTANLDPQVTSGSMNDLTGTDTVALSSTVAGGTRIGDTQQLWLGDGTSVNLRVVAVYDRGLGFGDALLPRALVAAHTTTALDDYLLVSGNTDLSAVATQFAGLHAATRDEYGKSLTDTARHQGVVNVIAVSAIAAFILIGVVTTLAVATAARRRELTLLRLIGTTRSQLLRSLRMEAALIIGTGTVAGATVAALTLLAFADGVTGLPMLTVSPLKCAAILAAVAIPATAAIMLPARVMLRRASPRIE